MFKDIPIDQIISDKALLRAAQSFVSKLLYSIKKQAKPKAKAFTIKEVGHTPVSYEDVKFDKDGWADATKYAPPRFEITTLKTDKNKEVNGWYRGGDWYSRKLGNKIKVTHWKKSPDLFMGGPQEKWEKC